jgi:hypothetical protein
MNSVCSFWLVLFDDKRLLSALLAVWTIISSVIFVMIMLNDGSKFLTCGPNSNNLLFGVALDTWSKWWAVALYTFFSTCIAALSGDAIWPFLTNVIMDPKTKYIPYSKMTCLTIIQVQTIYGTDLSKYIIIACPCVCGFQNTDQLKYACVFRGVLQRHRHIRRPLAGSP